jgi:hypothetical protein
MVSWELLHGLLDILKPKLLLLFIETLSAGQWSLLSIHSHYVQHVFLFFWREGFVYGLELMILLP